MVKNQGPFKARSPSFICLRQDSYKLFSLAESVARPASSLLFLCLLPLLFFAQGCSLTGKVQEGATPGYEVPEREGRGAPLSRRRYPRAGRLGPQGGRLGLQEKFDYPGVPQVEHPEVQRFINYFTGKGRSYIQEALARRAKYLPQIERVCEQYGLPPELSNIAFIESRFKPDARVADGSTVGMWQLASVTAQTYGLKVGPKVDERLDVAKSSEAALRFLASLYDSFGDWYLAAAAYNSGPARLRKGLKAADAADNLSSYDVFELTSRGIISTTSREFVAKFAALVIITTQLERYGFSQTGIAK